MGLAPLNLMEKSFSSGFNPTRLYKNLLFEWGIFLAKTLKILILLHYLAVYVILQRECTPLICKKLGCSSGLCPTRSDGKNLFEWDETHSIYAKLIVRVGRISAQFE